jgi:hypothetical protein
MTMDPLITGVINFKQAEMASRVQYAVAGKMLDAQKANGAAALKLRPCRGRHRAWRRA